ncbi:MAG: thiamine pyrophosphate-dependent enzyme [Flavonifractor plautii]
MVLNNSILGWIKWYEAAMWDGRFSEVDTETIDYAAVAEGLNCQRHIHSGPQDPSGRAEDGTGAGRASGHRHHHSGNGSM